MSGDHNINTGGPAFPQAIREEDGSTTYWHGISLRDYFAAKAMQGYFNAGVHDAEFNAVAKLAYKAADAMLKAREQ